MGNEHGCCFHAGLAAHHVLYSQPGWRPGPPSGLRQPEQPCYPVPRAPAIHFPLPTIHYGTPLFHFVPPCSTPDTKRGTPTVPFSGKVFHRPDRNGTLWNTMEQLVGNRPLQLRPTAPPRLRPLHNRHYPRRQTFACAIGHLCNTSVGVCGARPVWSSNSPMLRGTLRDRPVPGALFLQTEQRAG